LKVFPLKCEKGEGDCKVMHANCISTFDPLILSVLLKMTLNVREKK